MAEKQSVPGGRVTDAHGHSWRIGTGAEVGWIARATSPGLAITAAIPPVFDAYATIILPDSGADRGRHNRAMLALLEAEPAGQRWWLGYLRTDTAHQAFPGVAMAALPKVTLYAGWDYVLVEAGPRQAATWRRDDSLWWRDLLPDVMFPADRSWLAYRLTEPAPRLGSRGNCVEQTVWPVRVPLHLEPSQVNSVKQICVAEWREVYDVPPMAYGTAFAFEEQYNLGPAR
jgi:hypothetical protein